MANRKLTADDFSLSLARAGDERAAPGKAPRGKLSTRIDLDASDGEAMSLTYAFSARAGGSDEGLELPLLTVLTLKRDRAG